MNWLEKAVAKSYTVWNENGLPPYGWFHWIWILATVGSAVFSSWFFRKRPGLPLRIYCIVYSVVMILLEVWKQMGESYQKNGAGDYVWEYNWSYIPLQFCSTPMYVALLAGLICKGKIQNMFFSYLGTYGLFGGIIVYAVPMEVLGYQAIFSLLHTMFYHGFMIVICTTILVSHVELKHQSIIFACAVFSFFVVLATIINVVFHQIKPEKYFSLMHISPYFESRLPVLKLIQKVHYSLFIVMYVGLFTLVAYGILCLRMLIGWLVGKVKAKIELKFSKKKDDVMLKSEEGGLIMNEERMSGDDDSCESGDWPVELERESVKTPGSGDSGSS